MLDLPLNPFPSQTLSVSVDNNQALQIALYQRGYGLAAKMYLDLVCNGNAIITGRQCRSYGNLPNTTAPFMLAGAHYLPFLGDLLFVDTQATDAAMAPQPTGLGTRWLLFYLSQADLLAAAL